MKSNVRLIVTCILSAATAFFGLSCSVIEEYIEPQLEITVTEARLGSLGFTGATMMADVHIANRGYTPVDISKIAYGIFYRGSEVTTGVDETGWTIKPGKEERKNIPVFISIAEIGPLLNVEPDGSPADVRGIAACSNIFGDYKVPFVAETYLVVE